MKKPTSIVPDDAPKPVGHKHQARYDKPVNGFKNRKAAYDAYVVNSARLARATYHAKAFYAGYCMDAAYAMMRYQTCRHKWETAMLSYAEVCFGGLPIEQRRATTFAAWLAERVPDYDQTAAYKSASDDDTTAELSPPLGIIAKKK